MHISTLFFCKFVASYTFGILKNNKSCSFLQVCDNSSARFFRQIIWKFTLIFCIIIVYKIWWKTLFRKKQATLFKKANCTTELINHFNITKKSASALYHFCLHFYQTPVYWKKNSVVYNTLIGTFFCKNRKNTPN